MTTSDIVVGLVQYDGTFQTVLAFDKDSMDKYSFTDIMERYCDDDMNIAEEIQRIVLSAIDGSELMDMTLNEFILPDEIVFESNEDFKKYMKTIGFSVQPELDDFIASEYSSGDDSGLENDPEILEILDELPFDDMQSDETLSDDFSFDDTEGLLDL